MGKFNGFEKEFLSELGELLKKYDASISIDDKSTGWERGWDLRLDIDFNKFDENGYYLSTGISHKGDLDYDKIKKMVE